MPGRQFVGVQYDLLGRIERGFAARENRMFLAGLETDVVPVTILAVGNGGIVLFQARDDLAVDLVLQRLRTGPELRVIGVFGAEVGENGRVAALIVAQPVIGVRAGAMRRRDAVRADGGDGGAEFQILHGSCPRMRPEYSQSEERFRRRRDKGGVMQTVNQLIRVKGSQVFSVSPADSVTSGRCWS